MLRIIDINCSEMAENASVTDRFKHSTNPD